MAKILAVDDSATIRQLITISLGDGGHEIVLASDGQEGLRKAQSFRPNLVITDLNMPNMNGYELIAKLRGLQQYRGVPIIILTTEVNGSCKALAKKAGATGWVTKPFDPPKLLAAIRRVLG
ncbi:MAG: response regulator [Myxococcales bacterium]|nr:response regulator [Myxococcales bacterium]